MSYYKNKIFLVYYLFIYYYLIILILTIDSLFNLKSLLDSSSLIAHSSETINILTLAKQSTYSKFIGESIINAKCNVINM